jgi:hypothetical protein
MVNIIRLGEEEREKNAKYRRKKLVAFGWCRRLVPPSK